MEAYRNSDKEAKSGDARCAVHKARAFSKPGGWLYILTLVPVGMILYYLRLACQMPGILTSMRRLQILSPKTEILIYFNFLSAVGLILFALYILILFFRSKRLLPYSYLGLLISWSIVLVVKIVMEHQFLMGSIFLWNIYFLAFSIIASCTWLPVFRRSERVRLTFVR